MKTSFLFTLILLGFSLNLVHADELDQWVKDHLKQNATNFKAYHWATRVSGKSELRINRDEAMHLAPGQVSTNDQETAGYFKAMSGNFSGKNMQSWAIMDGFYGAYDPLQSMSYAGDPWVMIEIEVPAQTNYIILSELNKDIPLSFKYLRKIFPMKALSKYKGDGKEEFNIHDIFFYPKLKKLFLDAVKNYKVGFITYAWNKAYLEYCGKRHEAFNFIRPELLEEGVTLKVFAADYAKDGKTLKDHQQVAKKLMTVIRESDNQVLLGAPKYNSIAKWLSEFGHAEIYAPPTPSDIEELKAESFECVN